MDERIIDYIPMSKRRRRRFEEDDLVAVKCPRCRTRFVLNYKDAKTRVDSHKSVPCPECGFQASRWYDYMIWMLMYKIHKYFHEQHVEE